MDRADQLGLPLVALDGCAMTCCKNYIKQRGREPDLSIRFDKLGLMGQGERAFLPEDGRKALHITKDLIAKLKRFG
ncbi:hypothetical protein imdm_117 [gamma proteobacterium IMCC2047]|nr:hypothetical protein imdm_117 [gamma proteobacterium IMCC2047]